MTTRIQLTTNTVYDLKKNGKLYCRVLTGDVCSNSNFIKAVYLYNDRVTYDEAFRNYHVFEGEEIAVSNMSADEFEKLADAIVNKDKLIQKYLIVNCVYKIVKCIDSSGKVVAYAHMESHPNYDADFKTIITNPYEREFCDEGITLSGFYVNPDGTPVTPLKRFYETKNRKTFCPEFEYELTDMTFSEFRNILESIPYKI